MIIASRPAARPNNFGVSTPLKNVIYHNNVRATLTWSSTGCSVVPMEIEFDAAASEFDDALTAAGKEEADSVAHALLRNKLHRMVVQEVTSVATGVAPCAVRHAP